MNADSVLPSSETTREQISAKLKEVFAVIAQEMGVPIERIENVARGCRRRSLSDEERQLREEQIIRLRKECFTNEAIAKDLGLSLSTVALAISKLIQEGRLDAWSSGRAAGFQSKRATWRDKQNERVQIMIKLKKQLATYKEIGSALSITTERARQLAKKIAAEHGEDIFTPEELIWTVGEAAKELKIRSQTIISLCSRDEIPCRRRRLGKGNRYFLSQESIDALKQHPIITGERVCAACNHPFVYVQGRFKWLVCSQECESNYRRAKRDKCLSQELTVETLVGWHKYLWQRLQTHKPPKEERWLTLSEACKLTKLSRTQVGWLSLRRIIKTGEHPKKRWHGRPEIVYAASEMEIVRQVYEASKGQQ